MHRIGLVGSILIAVLAVNETLGQSFEVASVKPVPPGAGAPAIVVVSPGGRLTAANVTLRRLIRWAYHVQDFQIAGGPDGFNQPISGQVLVRTTADGKSLALHNLICSCGSKRCSKSFLRASPLTYRVMLLTPFLQKTGQVLVRTMSSKAGNSGMIRGVCQEV